MVHRAERIIDIFYLLRKYKLEPKQIRFVHSKSDKAPNLILIKDIKCAFSKKYFSCSTAKLQVQE